MGVGDRSRRRPRTWDSSLQNFLPHNLQNVFQATATIQIQPWPGDCLGIGCSDPAYRKYLADLNNNIKPVMNFLTKYPKPDLAFMQDLASGDICFSKEQADQSTLLLEELKRSNKVKVKAESIKEEPVLDREASSGAQDRGSADETKDVELILSFTSDAQMAFASKYATRVHHAIRCFGVKAILRTVRADFKNATYPDGLHSYIQQYMHDDPAHALRIISGLKFQSKESSIVENILILSNLKLKQGGFGGVFNKFRDCQEQLAVLEPKLDLNILTLFLMCSGLWPV